MGESDLSIGGLEILGQFKWASAQPSTFQPPSPTNPKCSGSWSL